jgi:hypothetical protein
MKKGAAVVDEPKVKLDYVPSMNHQQIIMNSKDSTVVAKLMTDEIIKSYEKEI